jgi:hypothetical protein
VDGACRAAEIVPDWRIASMKGADSMSPTVPPISQIEVEVIDIRRR